MFVKFDLSKSPGMVLPDARSVCCGGKSNCSGEIVFPSANILTEIVFWGSSGEVIIPISYLAGATALQIKNAILAAFLGVGYFDDEVANAVTVSFSGSDVRISTLGEIQLVSATHSGGAAQVTSICEQPFIHLITVDDNMAWVYQSVPISSSISSGNTWTLASTPADASGVFVFIDGISYRDKFSFAGNVATANFDLTIIEPASLIFQYQA